MNFNKKPCDFHEIISKQLDLNSNNLYIEKKIPINCEDMQYTNDQSDNDEEDEEEEKSNSSGAKQPQLLLANKLGQPKVVDAGIKRASGGSGSNSTQV